MLIVLIKNSSRTDVCIRIICFTMKKTLKDNQANSVSFCGKLNCFYLYCPSALIPSATMFKGVARPTPLSLLQTRRLRRFSRVSDHIEAPIFKEVNKVFDVAVALSPISHGISNYVAHSSPTVASSCRMRLFDSLSAPPRRLVSSRRFCFSWL